MKKISILILMIIAGCGAKRTQNQLASGNYDEAIETASEHLRNNKDKQRKQDYIYMLEEAFAKAKDRDLRNIELMKKEGNPANLERIYESYLNLHDRQEKIKPLLPLQLIKERRKAKFPFDDYSKEIISSRANLSEYLYSNATNKIKSGNKTDARKAYDDLQYLRKINPGYKESEILTSQAIEKGTDYVTVFTKNETNMAIPARLEADLLDFSTLGLNDKWTVYHSDRQKGREYDYGIAVNFREINISPEHLKEKEFVREKQIKDGRKKLLDRNGNPVRDSLGKQIMVDNMKTVKATISEFRQFKTCQVTAKVDYVDINGDQLIKSFPLASEFMFEHIYATYKGDRRAADDDYRAFFDRRPMPFPSNEQMVFDTGEDLKAKLKSIITGNRFRR